MRALAVLVLVLCGAGHAEAGRKRLVVLEFEGDKAEKFHADVVKLLKKNHTVVPTKKWDAAADELGASKANEKNIKKVAKKLKIDGVITGNVEKRRDSYIIRLKLRAGVSGELVGSQVNIKADGPKLDSGAQGDLRDELFDSIDSLESNRKGGGGDEEEEEEEKPAKKGFGKKGGDEEEAEEEKPAKKGFSKKSFDEEEEPVKKAVAKKPEPKQEPVKKSRDDEEEDPLPKKKSKKVAARDDEGEEEEEEGIEEEGEIRASMGSELGRSPGNRAVDAHVGMSFTMRRMGFTYDPNRVAKPPGYKGTPVAGAIVDLTVYPLALIRKDGGMLKNLGGTVLYDTVLFINSKDQMGNKVDTSQARYAVGAVFRYPFGTGITAPVVGARLRYGRQNFTIDGNVGVPNVNYTIIDPGVFFKLPLSAKLAFNLSASYLAILKTGQIQKADQYGAATVSGFEGDLSADYLLTGGVFLRAGVKYETIGFSFSGTGSRTMMGAVGGARDTYMGAAVTAGYVF